MSSEPAPLVVLLASPLLGPQPWQPVAGRLSRNGWAVAVPDVPAAERTSPGRVLTALLAALPVDRPLALVAHSGAGPYVAALAAERDVRALVLVDAGLPDLAPRTPVAPPALLEHLGTLVGADGLLPPWTAWWPAADVDPLFPDAATRSTVEDGQPLLPLAYFRGAVPSPPPWTGLLGGYLAFGDTYADELGRAEQLGWSVTRRGGGHLHQLVDPAGVTADVEQLLRALLDRGAAGWATTEELRTAGQRFAAGLPGFVLPAAYGLLRLDREGPVSAHVNRPGAVRPLPAVVLASVCGHVRGTATYRLDRRRVARAVALLSPAAAATHVEHPNLWSWRALLDDASPDSAFVAVFVGDAEDSPVDEHDAAFRRLLTEG